MGQMEEEDLRERNYIGDVLEKGPVWSILNPMSMYDECDESKLNK